MITEKDQLLEEECTDDELYHYGVKRRSGRYPWGSGDDPYQHSTDYINRVNELRKSGVPDTEIAKQFGQSTTDFRLEYKAALHDRKNMELQKMISLKEKGYSTYKIGEIMGISESSVRSKLNPHAITRLQEAQKTYEFLKQQVAEKQYIDVGEGVERELNISKDKLAEAVYMLKMEGYEVHERYVDQLTLAGQQTTFKVLCPPNTDYQEFRKMDLSNIKQVTDYKSTDDGQSFQPKNVYPKSMDPSRLMIRYKEDGGIEKDGIIELRRGVEDLDLQGSRYSQVRILVDNDRYLKGMAVYSDDMPDGVDVIFNTNKGKDVPMRDVLKKIKDDPDNPFGSSIKSLEQGGQYWYTDKNGKKQLGLINKRSDEGDWEDWSNTLPSQFLSKQPLKLAKRQLDLASQEKIDEYNDICALTNPTVKKKLLEEFASNCDSAAVHLKAAALPRQQYHVIIPLPSLKDNEVYAPGYNDGEKVALIRYPHGGTFEIPILTVNNKHAAAKKLLGTDVIDAVCINSKVAERLSGADFDGDTVMVIPTNDKVNIKSTPTLEGLKDFDAKMIYGTVEGEDGNRYNQYGQKIKVMNNTQNEMGRVSNLITDMTLKGATKDELARAVRHSMVVIDAEKHKLDYKQSEIDNNIKALKDKYQRTYDEETGKMTGGASTLISKAKSQTSVYKRQGTPKINTKYKSNGKPNPDYDPSKPEGSLLYKTADDLFYAKFLQDKANNQIGYRLSNGKKVMFDKDDKEAYEYYKPIKKVNPETGEVTFTNKTGEYSYRVEYRTQKSTKMAEADDAKRLLSENGGTPMENLYADYANKMKALANQARKEMVYTGDIEYSSAANQTYSKEVSSLMAKLNRSSKNKTRERTAQLLGNSEVEAKKAANKDMGNEELRKLKQQALERARATVGAKRELIDITDREWEAIQAGAITKTKLKEILNYADMDVVRQKAMPRSVTKLSTAQVNKIKSMNRSGRYTLQDMAAALGVSTSTVSLYLKGKETASDE